MASTVPPSQEGGRRCDRCGKNRHPPHFYGAALLRGRKVSIIPTSCAISRILLRCRPFARAEGREAAVLRAVRGLLLRCRPFARAEGSRTNTQVMHRNHFYGAALLRGRKANGLDGPARNCPDFYGAALLRGRKVRSIPTARKSTALLRCRPFARAEGACSFSPVKSGENSPKSSGSFFRLSKGAIFEVFFAVFNRIPLSHKDFERVCRRALLSTHSIIPSYEMVCVGRRYMFPFALVVRREAKTAATLWHCIHVLRVASLSVEISP